MCNFYSLTKGQDAIRQLTEAMRDTTGNLPPFPGSSHWLHWTGELVESGTAAFGPQEKHLCRSSMILCRLPRAQDRPSRGCRPRPEAVVR